MPELVLPAALIRFWPDSQEQGGLFDSLGRAAGIRRLGEHMIGILPLRGRGQVFDLALSLARRILMSRGGLGEGNLPGLLIFPGNVKLGNGSAEIVPSRLFEDLERQGPDLPAGKICVTGYVASWLGGRFLLGSEVLWAAPSGRRLPIREVLSPITDIVPWHNQSLLGREGSVHRGDVEATLAQVGAEPVFEVTGSLGCGKTAAVWRAIDGPKGWVGLGRTVGAGELWRGLSATLARWCGSEDPNVTHPASASLPIEQQVDWLAGAAEAARARLGTVPRFVVDDAHLAAGRTPAGRPPGGRPPVSSDQQLLAALLDEKRFLGACGLVCVGRSPVAPLSDAVPRIEIPPMTEAQMNELFGELMEHIELHEKVRGRFLSASAGRPFAFEEGLVQLLHQNKVRSVYGSFFYAGTSGQAYEASERLVRHTAAEAERLGASIGARMLALADQSIEPGHVALAAQRFGAVLETDWYQPYLDAGWIEMEAPSTHSEPSGGQRIRFAYTALAQALKQTVSDQGRGRLRHALGSALAGSQRDQSKWDAYRLMAGSPEALPPLLDFTKVSTGVVSTRDEVFFALWSEHKEAVQRGVDSETELRILWALLPLGRRLGKLSELESELARGVELARGDGQKWVPLVALKAELDMEKGNFRQAENGLREALSASEGLGQQRRATLFIRLGALLQREERLEEAAQVFLQLLSVVDHDRPSALGASCRFYLGNIALQQKKVDDARALHREAADFRRERQLQRPLGQSLTALGTVALTEGDFSLALQYFDEAEEVLSKAGAEPWDMASAYLGKGRALRQLGEITRSTKVLRRALEAQEGRPNKIEDSEARLELAASLLLLDQDAEAVEEARRAHFQLSLAEELSLLGNAELLLGRMLLKQKDFATAREHLERALQIFGRHGKHQGQAESHSWLIVATMGQSDADAVLLHAAELRDVLEDLELPASGEQMHFRLYRGFQWLSEKGYATPDPMASLRRSYSELMRKTNYLKPERRHAFLYQVREHQEILNTAAQHQISLPIFTVGS